MSTKVSRRKLIKIMAAGGAAIAAAPLLARASSIGKQQGSGRKTPSETTNGALSATSAQQLVVVVRGDQVLGYKGAEEISVQDAALASTLHAKFDSARGTLA